MWPSPAECSPLPAPGALPRKTYTQGCSFPAQMGQLFCLFERPWLFLWLGQEHFSLLLCSSSPSSLLDCSEIPSLSSSFAYFQDVFCLGMHSAMYLSWIHIMNIYLDAQTMGMRLIYRGGQRPLRSSDPSISFSFKFIDNNSNNILMCLLHPHLPNKPCSILITSLKESYFNI